MGSGNSKKKAREEKQNENSKSENKYKVQNNSDSNSQETLTKNKKHYRRKSKGASKKNGKLESDKELSRNDSVRYSNTFDPIEKLQRVTMYNEKNPIYQEIQNRTLEEQFHTKTFHVVEKKNLRVMKEIENIFDPFEITIKPPKEASYKRKIKSKSQLHEKEIRSGILEAIMKQLQSNTNNIRTILPAFINFTNPEVHPFFRKNFERIWRFMKLCKKNKFNIISKRELIKKLPYLIRGDIIEERLGIVENLNGENSSNSSFLVYRIYHFELNRMLIWKIPKYPLYKGKNTEEWIKEYKIYQSEMWNRWKNIESHEHILKPIHRVNIEGRETVLSILTEDLVMSRSLHDLVSSQDIYIKHGKRLGIDIAETLYILARDISSMLSSLHKENEHHLNLHPRNILCTVRRSPSQLINFYTTDLRSLPFSSKHHGQLVREKELLQELNMKMGCRYYPPELGSIYTQIIDLVGEQPKSPFLNNCIDSSIVELLEKQETQTLEAVDVYSFGVIMLFSMMGGAFWESTQELNDRLVNSLAVTDYLNTIGEINEIFLIEDSILDQFINLLVQCLGVRLFSLNHISIHEISAAVDRIGDSIQRARIEGPVEGTLDIINTQNNIDTYNTQNEFKISGDRSPRHTTPNITGEIRNLKTTTKEMHFLFEGVEENYDETMVLLINESVEEMMDGSALEGISNLLEGKEYFPNNGHIILNTGICEWIAGNIYTEDVVSRVSRGCKLNIPPLPYAQLLDAVGEHSEADIYRSLGRYLHSDSRYLLSTARLGLLHPESIHPYVISNCRTRIDNLKLCRGGEVTFIFQRDQGVTLFALDGTVLTVIREKGISADVDANGLVIAIGYRNGFIALFIYNTQLGTHLQFDKYLFQISNHLISIIKLSADGEYGLSGGGDGTLTLWNTGQQNILLRIPPAQPHSFFIRGLSTTHDLAYIAYYRVADTHATFFSLNLKTKIFIRLTQFKMETQITCISLTLEGSYLLLGTIDGLIAIFNTKTFNRHKHIKFTSCIENISITPLCKFILVKTREEKVYLFELETGINWRTWSYSREGGTGIAITYDNILFEFIREQSELDILTQIQCEFDKMTLPNKFGDSLKEDEKYLYMEFMCELLKELSSNSEEEESKILDYENLNLYLSTLKGGRVVEENIKNMTYYTIKQEISKLIDPPSKIMSKTTRNTSLNFRKYNSIMGGKSRNREIKTFYNDLTEKESNVRKTFTHNPRELSKDDNKLSRKRKRIKMFTETAIWKKIMNNCDIVKVIAAKPKDRNALRSVPVRLTFEQKFQNNFNILRKRKLFNNSNPLLMKIVFADWQDGKIVLNYQRLNLPLLGILPFEICTKSEVSQEIKIGLGQKLQNIQKISVNLLQQKAYEYTLNNAKEFVNITDKLFGYPIMIKVWSELCNLYLKEGRIKDVYQVKEMREYREIHQESEIEIIIFSGNGRYMCILSTNFILSIWDCTEWTFIKYLLIFHPQFLTNQSISTPQLIEQLFDVSIMQISNNCEKIIIGRYNGNVEIWGVDKGVVEYCVIAHYSQVNTIDISYDDNLFLSSSNDFIVNIWNLNNYSLIIPFNKHMSGVTSARFISPRNIENNREKYNVISIEKDGLGYIYRTNGHILSRIILSTKSKYLIPNLNPWSILISYEQEHCIHLMRHSLFASRTHLQKIIEIEPSESTKTMKSVGFGGSSKNTNFHLSMDSSGEILACKSGKGEVVSLVNGGDLVTEWRLSLSLTSNAYVLINPSYPFLLIAQQGSLKIFFIEYGLSNNLKIKEGKGMENSAKTMVNWKESGLGKEVLNKSMYDVSNNTLNL